MIRFAAITASPMSTDPFQWAHIRGLFSSADSAALVAGYPEHGYKTMVGGDAEKQWRYEVSAAIDMGASEASALRRFGQPWRRLLDGLTTSAYRAAISEATGVDVTLAPMEANVFHYGPGAWLGPHCDLPTKVVTHVLYFNDTWDAANGGTLRILRSASMEDVEAVVNPLVGESTLFVRSDDSWHAVDPVAEQAPTTRRSLVVTFYRPGSPSTMWPDDESPSLHSLTADGRP